ncbi:MAG: Alpha/Beta hydrolase protein [Piptocephalis tieghemiana]|nr:MAG: Alpha/Beta hydrolase protein [Piptocephalis tieghemiana]
MAPPHQTPSIIYSPLPGTLAGPRDHAKPTHSSIPLQGPERCIQFEHHTLESGKIISPCPVVYASWGKLNEAKDNVILVCHAFSGSSNVSHWWGAILGDGKALDPSNYFIICINVLGSPYGTASPLTPSFAKGGRPYGPDFPLTTIRDDVRLQRRLLDYLGITKLHTVIGGSMGGMVALEWAVMHGESGYVHRLLPISTSGRLSAWAVGWNEIQRRIITSDPLFLEGHYPEDRPPTQGLATARMSALLTYRSHQSVQDRFQRKQQPGKSGIFSIQSYLEYQGDKFLSRFDANCYIALTHKLDSHDVAHGRPRPYEAILGSITCPTLVIGIPSDVLFPLSEQQELSYHLPNATLCLVTSSDGHDGFFIEDSQVNDLIHSFITAPSPV